MLKPNETYRMSTENKYRLAKVRNEHLRGEIKRGIIDADLTAAIKPARDKPQSNGKPTAKTA